MTMFALVGVLALVVSLGVVAVDNSNNTEVNNNPKVEELNSNTTK